MRRRRQSGSVCVHQRLWAVVTRYLGQAKGSRSAAQLLLQRRASRQDPMEHHVLIHLDRPRPPPASTPVHQGVSAKCLQAAGLRRGLQHEVR